MNLYQYDEIEISKEYLLTTGYYLLYREEKFEMDNQVIALFDISVFGLSDGRTLVLHLEYGVIIDSRSTKQLMNELYRANGFGFALTKVLAGLFNIRHYLPFVHAYQVYMPLSGGSRQNTDWISLNLIAKAQLSNGLLHLITVNGTELRVNFLYGDWEKRVHDAALLSQASFLFLRAVANWGNCELQVPTELGLLQAFEDCCCGEHLDMRGKIQDLNSVVVAIKKMILNNLGIDKFQKVEAMKFYGQNLTRLKKLY